MSNREEIKKKIDELMETTEKAYREMIKETKEKGDADDILEIVQRIVSALSEVGVPILMLAGAYRSGVKSVRDELVEAIELLDAIKYESGENQND